MVELSGIPNGRGIDEDEQPLLAVGIGCAAIISVSGANVDGRLSDQLLAVKYVGELPLVIAREKDVVTRQRKAARLGDYRPSHGRKGAARPWEVDGMRRFVTETAVVNGSWISVEDDAVETQKLTRVQLDRGGMTSVQVYLTSFRLVAECDTHLFTKPGERRCQSVHAPAYQPDTALFDMGDEHEGRRRFERR